MSGRQLAGTSGIVWLIALLAGGLPGCTDDNSTGSDGGEFPTVISGRVIEAGTGAPVGNAIVSLPTAPAIDPQWTGSDGFYRFDSFPAGQHMVRVECFGYELYESPVPKPVNGVSTLNPSLTRRTYQVPPVKPLGKGRVRVRNRSLESDIDGDGSYRPYLVKGTAFSPTPISGLPVPRAVYDRSMQLLSALNANTIRTYSGADPYMLQKAAEYGIRVIVGYWIPLDMDLTDVANRTAVKDGFVRLVTELKNYPAVAIWNIGNEQNLGNGNDRAWFSLVQELAVIGYMLEGDTYHPVCASNGGFANIGNAALEADDASLSYMDLWGSNNYEWDFTASFASFRSRTGKPVVITEFGIDALDNRTKQQYEDVQAQFDSTNWMQILAAGDICVGATVFEFTDEWWKAGSPPTHDYGGYASSNHPDGYSNEEWWGLIAVTPDADGDGLDEWRPRAVYYTFQRLWQ